MHVKLTQEHIDNGQSQSSTQCALALALLEAGLDEVIVFGGIVGFSGQMEPAYTLWVDLP